MLKHGVVLALALLVFSSCGKKVKDTPYTGDPTVPLLPIDDTKPSTPDPQPQPQPAQPDPHHPVQPTPPAPPHDTPTKSCDKTGGDYSEGIAPQPGQFEGHDYGFGGGCIRRPILEVWATSLNQALMQWVDVDDSRALEYAPPAGVAFFFSVNYAVHKFITVDWDMDWFHTVKAGTKQAPEKILINYQKVRGTSHIQFWRGTILLTRVNDHVTSFTMGNQISADQTSAQDAADAVKDVYGKLQTGAPDWSHLQH